MPLVASHDLDLVALHLPREPRLGLGGDHTRAPLLAHRLPVRDVQSQFLSDLPFDRFRPRKYQHSTHTRKG